MSKKTKIVFGSGMMAAGCILTINAIDEFDIFNTTSSDEWQFGIGLGLLGAGTVFLILGLTDKNSTTEDYQPLTEKGLQTTFGFAPTRGGIRGSVNFRW